MSGSEASNLGYGEYPPNHNINGSFVNVNATNNPANFGSNEIPPRGLFGASCNMDAAAGIAPGICMGGGKKRAKSTKKSKKSKRAMKSLNFNLLKQKIKNISNIYKMRYTKKQRKQIKRKISKKYIKKSRRNVSSRRSRRSRMGRRMRKMQKGGAMTELAYSDFPGAEDYAGTKLSYNETGASSGYGFHVPSGDAQLNSALSSPTPINPYAKM
jgi:hypothetical protein